MSIFVAFFVLLLLLAENTPPAASNLPLIGILRSGGIGDANNLPLYRSISLSLALYLSRYPQVKSCNNSRPNAFFLGFIRLSFATTTTQLINSTLLIRLFNFPRKRYSGIGDRSVPGKRLRKFLDVNE